MNVGHNTGLPNRGKKRREVIERSETSLTDRRILQEDYRGVWCRFFERLK